MTSARDLEHNEVSWWSYWTDVHWAGANSYTMLSSSFEEYFFNRAGFVDCRDARETIPKIEAEFEAAGQPPCFSVQDECRDAADALISRGYTTFDRMSVMQLDRPRFRTAVGLTVLSGQDVLAADWAAAYSLSFYGDLQTRDSVALITERLRKEPSVTLFAGRKGGRTLGILAAFRTPGLLGAYCIGTLDRYRRLGVAGSLIREANMMASAEGRACILQTIVSEKAEDFYRSGGFRRLYMKRLMRRETSALKSPGRMRA